MRLDSERAYHRDLEQFQHEQVLFCARVPESIAPRRIWRKRVQCEQPGASGSRLPSVAGFSETGGPGCRRLTVSDVLRIPPVQRRRLAGSMDRYRYLGLTPSTKPFAGYQMTVSTPLSEGPPIRRNAAT